MTARTIATTEVTTPDWVKHAVFYQIFPDRFAKSDRLEKPTNLEPWDDEPTAFGYKGGDLLGIVERLDHIQDLGITALYLNPIFQSASNHRYHTHDYYRVDPLLGGDAAFDELLDACHQRGIRVVLDGVFNHASRGFFQFNDVLENHGASPWLDWFTFGDFPANAYDLDREPGYVAWVGLHALPKFNTDNPQVREFLMRVGEQWIRKGIDGWRLDVAAEITTPGFWQEFRTRVKAINPDAYLVAEIWHDSRPWLRGDQFDAVMSYLFTEAAIAFAGGHRVIAKTVAGRGYSPHPGIDAPTYAARIDRLLGLYPWPIQLAQLNLLDSHDTSRLISIAGGDVGTVRLAALLMFTFSGAPCIYYGDEIGLTGGLPDHFVRRTFPWDHPDRWDRGLLATYKELIALRQAQPALRIGSYHRLHAEGNVYAFARAAEETTLVVAVNVGEDQAQVRIPLSASVRATPVVLFGNRNAIAPAMGTNGLALTLPARAGVVLDLSAPPSILPPASRAGFGNP